MGAPCALCGGPIRYDITGPEAGKHPDAFTLDHVVPLSLGGELLDITNARAAHRRCNSARGNRVAPARRDTSRRWYRR